MKKRRSTPKTSFLFWLCVVIALFLFALIGPHFIRHDPYLVNLRQVTRAPSHQYIMGTDYLGRCIFCRLVTGASRSIFAALAVVAITFVIGTTLGILCGYVGGSFDLVVMRFVDSVQAFPSMVFTIAMAAMLGNGMRNCIIAMSAIGWTSYCRLARAQVISIKESTFVAAAKISGMSNPQILWKTVLPNSLTSLIVSASMHVGNAILSFSGLSYLGLGTSPPFPEWGNMLNDGKATMQLAPWTVIYPGLAILLIVMIMGLFGDSVNRYLNPKENTDA